MKGFIHITTQTGDMYLAEASIVSYQRSTAEGVGWQIKTIDGAMVHALTMEETPTEFVRIRYGKGERYIAFRHIVSFRAATDCVGFTIKTADGYVHKSDKGMGDLLAQIDAFNRAKPIFLSGKSV